MKFIVYRTARLAAAAGLVQVCASRVLSGFLSVLPVRDWEMGGGEKGRVAERHSIRLVLRWGPGKRFLELTVLNDLRQLVLVAIVLCFVHARRRGAELGLALVRVLRRWIRLRVALRVSEFLCLRFLLNQIKDIVKFELDGGRLEAVTYQPHAVVAVLLFVVLELDDLAGGVS